MLFFRGITLDGAEEGLKFYLADPDWSKVFSATTWGEALKQLCFSLGIGYGGLIGLASYSRPDNNCYRVRDRGDSHEDALILFRTPSSSSLATQSCPLSVAPPSSRHSASWRNRRIARCPTWSKTASPSLSSPFPKLSAVCRSRNSGRSSSSSCSSSSASPLKSPTSTSSALPFVINSLVCARKNGSLCWHGLDYCTWLERWWWRMEASTGSLCSMSMRLECLRVVPSLRKFSLSLMSTVGFWIAESHDFWILQGVGTCLPTWRRCLVHPRTRSVDTLANTHPTLDSTGCS